MAGLEKCRGRPRLACLAVVFVSLLLVAPVRGDIYQWEWVDPLDPAQGKRESSTVCLGGSGLDAVPGADLGFRYLMKAYFIGKELTDVDFTETDLTEADFTDANLRGTTFDDTELNYVNFNGANLTHTDFYADEKGRNDGTGADARSATQFGHASGFIITRNLVYPDGHVEGIDLQSGEVWRLWDYNHETPLPIAVEGDASFAATGALRVVFEDQLWGSTISFSPGGDVVFDGTLQLLFSEDVARADMVGTTFDLFDFGDVVPSGQFGAVTSEPGMIWNLSDLYTAGTVTLVAIPEPSTLILAAGGLLGLSLAGCRRRGRRVRTIGVSLRE